MFTGIIEEMGTVLAITKNAQSAVLRIAAKTVTEDVKRGDSIAVNGVCLTVTSHRADEFTADVMHETLDRSSLGELHEGSKVNLERALRLDSRLGGHIVTGHIDGTGGIRRVRADANAIWYSIAGAAARQLSKPTFTFPNPQPVRLDSARTKASPGSIMISARTSR